MKENENILFVCYSIPLKDFLISKGFKSKVNGKHCETGNPFWVFIRSEKLNKALDEWRSTK